MNNLKSISIWHPQEYTGTRIKLLKKCGQSNRQSVHKEPSSQKCEEYLRSLNQDEQGRQDVEKKKGESTNNNKLNLNKGGAASSMQQ